MERKKFLKQGIWNAFKSAIQTTEDTYQTVKKTITPDEIKEEKSNLQPDEKFIQFPEVTKTRRVIRNLKNPPGSNPDKKIYEKKCVGCGDCITACQYNAIFPVFNVSLNKNIAHIDTNANACMMCIDYPCISACDHDALKPLKKKTLPKFGQAKLQKDSCINQKTGEYSCNSCKTSCPVENVILYNRSYLPTFSNECTGCGICVQACPSFPKAISVR